MKNIQELKNALSVIKSCMGMKIYEICESSIYNKGCDIDDYNWEKSALSDIEVHELVNFWNEILVPNLIDKARAAFVYYR